jgi:hypothetical protein
MRVAFSWRRAFCDGFTHRVDFRGPVEEVVEAIAASAGDDHQAGTLVEREELTVDAWVFPRRVVDQAPAVNGPTERVVRELANPFGCPTHVLRESERNHPRST